MSDSRSQDGPSETGGLPTPSVGLLVGGTLAVVLLAVLATRYTSPGSQLRGPAAEDAQEAVAQRIAPVARVVLQPETVAKAPRTGEQVFQTVCTACHTAGVAGAPKIGDVAAWAPRIKGGYEALFNSALKGKGGMPPQGGGAVSDDELGRAVVYMANQGGARFNEPKAPAAAASAAP
jgi:cytochrome c5